MACESISLQVPFLWFPFDPQLGKLVRKPRCFLFPWAWVGKFKSCKPWWTYRNLSLTVLITTIKTSRFIEAKWASLDCLSCSLQKASCVMNVFVSSWSTCGIMSLDMGSNYGKGWLVLSFAEQPKDNWPSVQDGQSDDLYHLGDFLLLLLTCF